MLKEITVDEKEDFPPEQIQRFKDDEEFYQKFVKGIEKDTAGNFRIVRHTAMETPSPLLAPTSPL